MITQSFSTFYFVWFVIYSNRCLRTISISDVDLPEFSVHDQSSIYSTISTYKIVYEYKTTSTEKLRHFWKKPLKSLTSTINLNQIEYLTISVSSSHILKIFNMSCYDFILYKLRLVGTENLYFFYLRTSNIYKWNKYTHVYSTPLYHPLRMSMICKGSVILFHPSNILVHGILNQDQILFIVWINSNNYPIFHFKLMNQ